jgi:hypothetical protein
LFITVQGCNLEAERENKSFKMATFQIKTNQNRTLTMVSVDEKHVRHNANMNHLRVGEKIESIKIIPDIAKTLPVGFEVVKTVCMGNEMISERMDEVEASYIRYWISKREFWMAKTEAEIDEMFPQRYNSRAYYRSEYYKLHQEGAVTKIPAYYERWLNKIKKEAAQAKEKSIWNMINAILKIAKCKPVSFFKVINIVKGKAGLEGSIRVNNLGARLFAIYAEGPIQRLHIRYLIKGVHEIKEAKSADSIAADQAARIKALK